MGLLILLMVLSVLAILPFVWLRRPWALALWRRIKMIVVLYALIIFLAGVVRLIFNWDDIYG